MVRKDASVMVMDENARLRVALHESGHAVAGRLHGYSILELRINSEGTEGVCSHDPPPSLTPQARAYVLAAGCVAECMYGKLGRLDHRIGCAPSSDPRFYPGTPSDTEKLAVLGMDWGTPGLVSETMALLDPHADAVEGLANALLRRLHLSGEDAETILISYSVPKPEQ